MLIHRWHGVIESSFNLNARENELHYNPHCCVTLRKFEMRNKVGQVGIEKGENKMWGNSKEKRKSDKVGLRTLKMLKYYCWNYCDNIVTFLKMVSVVTKK